MTLVNTNVTPKLRSTCALALALFFGIAFYLAPLDPNILHLQFAFNEQSFKAVLSMWQSSGIARYRSHFPADFLFLAAYGLSGFWFGRERAPAHSGLATYLTWSLPIAAVADATENALHLVLTSSNASTNTVLYFLSGSAASIKWLGILVFALSLVALYMRKRE